MLKGLCIFNIMICLFISTTISLLRSCTPLLATPSTQPYYLCFSTRYSFSSYHLTLNFIIGSFSIDWISHYYLYGEHSQMLLWRFHPKLNTQYAYKLNETFSLVILCFSRASVPFPVGYRTPFLLTASQTFNSL